MQIHTYLKAKSRISLIKKKEQFDQLKDQCIICFDLVTGSVQCDICKTKFCFFCAIKWRQKYDKCPKKCSSPWKFHQVKEKQFQLVCPFSQKCNAYITPQNLINHVKQCDYLPEQMKQRSRLKKQFLCLKSHRLRFYAQKFIDLSQQICQDCNQTTLCRSYCDECSTFYCIECRMPQLVKSICPLKSHVYLKKNSHEGFYCDMCGIQPYFFNKKIYDDMQCNFGLCQTCFETIPGERQEQNQLTFSPLLFIEQQIQQIQQMENPFEMGEIHGYSEQQGELNIEGSENNTQ